MTLAAFPGQRSLTFRFMLRLQKWCRRHRRRFPRRLGRLLLVHGAVPLLAIIMGLAAEVVTLLPQLLLPIEVWPFTGTPATSWDRYVTIILAVGLSPWAIALMSLVLYLLTVSLIWITRRASPTLRQKRYVQVASWIVIAGSLPMYDAALEALAVASLLGLLWAFFAPATVPPADNPACGHYPSERR